MIQPELFAEKRRELVNVASAMLVGEFDLIEGVRRICSLRFAVGDPDNEVFLPIRGIDSETDAFPVGSMRSNLSPQSLMRLDAERQRYLADAKGDILRACGEIVQAFT